MNMVLNQPAVHTNGPKFVCPADPADILDIYKAWEPRLVRLISKIPKERALEWKLCDLEPMDSWVFPGGKVALLGDACHAMLPSAAQGAGMCIEDGAAIAELLARVTNHSQIPAAMKAYQELRLPRCSYVVDSGRQNASKWHEKDAKGGTTTDDMWDYDVKKCAQMMEIQGV